YVSVFKTSRIEKNTETEANFINHVYYFEIPMNDGEFCLGSVKGGVGCYLMYLDIGANAAKTQRTIISEHFTLKEEKMTYPVGVAFVSYSTSAIDDTDSVAMTIPKGFAGNTLTVSRSDNAITIKENNSTALTGNLVYLGDKITIEPSIQAKLKPKSSTTKDVRRVQYYDYNVNLEKVTKTIITDTYLNGTETPTRTIEQYSLEADGETWTAIAEEDRKVFQTKNGTAYDAAILANPTSLPLDGAMGSGGIGWVNPGSTVLLSFYYTMAEGVSATESLTLNMAIDTAILDGQYYSFNDYAFVITCTGGTITIKVLTIGTGTITINGTTVASAGQTIEVTTS
ncbi:MAG: hypothetical protein J6O18_02815, partial [Bacilli bacterium]|nr:hypothetical protein [Bacilli bacterium]